MGYITELGELFLAKNYKREKLAFIKGSGTRLFTEEGEEYLDFTAGIGVCNLGHAYPELLDVLQKQAKLLWHTSNLYYTAPQAKLAKKLVDLSFAEEVFFANSGAEAVESALKLARRFAYENWGANKNQFIALKNSFHGRTLGALSVTGQFQYWEGFEPLLPGVIFIPPNDKKALETHFNENICGIIIEPIQGEGGVYVLEKEFIELAKDLCQKYNALLIFDEIQTGIGRTGKLFAYEHFQIEPDIMCLAKALANGLPLSAMLAKKHIMSAFKPGTHASTFGGNPICCEVALKVLEIISDPLFLKEVELKGKVLKEKIHQLKQKKPNIIKEIRGLGLLIGIEFNISAEQVYKKLLEKRILVTQPKPNIIRLSPALIINYKEIDFFINTLQEILMMIETNL